MGRALLSIFAVMLAALPVRAADQSTYPLWIERVLLCPVDQGEVALPHFDEQVCRATPLAKIDPARRLLWIRAHVTITDEPPQPLALYFSAQASSQAFVNGIWLGSNGRPSVTPSREVTGMLDHEFYVPPGLLHSGDNIVALKLSAQQLPEGTHAPLHRLGLAGYGSLKGYILRSYLPTLAVSGALVLAGLLFFAAFTLDRRQFSTILLALLALTATAQLGAEVWRGVAPYGYPVHQTRVLTIMLLAALNASLLAAFLAARFRSVGVAKAAAASAVLSLFAMVAVPDPESRTVTILAMAALLGLAIASRALLRGQPGARLTVVGLALYLVLLLLIGPREFLSRDFYIAVSVLMAALFVDQLLALRRDRVARAEAESRAARLELDLLRKGMAPHFLLNSLNSLAEWVEADSAVGVKMIHALADHMRTLSAIADAEWIPLADEIALVRSYFAVMSFRGDTTFKLDVRGSPDGIKVPPAVLHTLAENGFSHNRYPDGGTFGLAITGEDERVWLRFETPPSAGSKARSGNGEGIGYVKGRLAEAFGTAFELTADALSDGRWITTIAVPAARP
jgi:Histidine kinase